MSVLGTFDPYVFDWPSGTFDTSDPGAVTPASFGRSDVGLGWDVVAADLGLYQNDLARDGGLETAVIIALFTDRRAEQWDTLPAGQRDRRGVWMDAFPVVPADKLGSRLWLISREKEMRSVLDRAKEYAEEALRWLLEDKIASSVSVATSIVRRGVLGIAVTIERPNVDQVDYRFNYTWEAQAARG